MSEYLGVIKEFGTLGVLAYVLFEVNKTLKSLEITIAKLTVKLNCDEVKPNA